jgi:hypothetical protein
MLLSSKLYYYKLSFTILFVSLSTSTLLCHPQQERDGDTSNTQQQQQQHEATIRSIDETKNNIHQALEEVKR